jgi:hypothetical protein
MTNAPRSGAKRVPYAVGNAAGMEKKASVDWTLSCLALQSCDKEVPPDTASLILVYLQQPDHPNFGQSFVIGKQGYPFRANFLTIASYSSVVRSMHTDVALDDKPIPLAAHVDMDHADERVAFLDVWLSMMGLITRGSAGHLMTVNQLVAIFEWLSYLGLSVQNTDAWTRVTALTTLIRPHGDEVKPTVSETRPQLGKLLRYCWTIAQKSPLGIRMMWQNLVDEAWQARNLDEGRDFSEMLHWQQALNKKDWKAMKATSMPESARFLEMLTVKCMRTDWEKKSLTEASRLALAYQWTVTVRDAFGMTQKEMEIPEDVLAKYEEAKQNPAVSGFQDRLLQKARPEQLLETFLTRMQREMCTLVTDLKEMPRIWTNQRPTRPTA